MHIKFCKGFFRTLYLTSSCEMYADVTESENLNADFSVEIQTAEALRLVSLSLKELPDRERALQWVILGTHAVLQGSFSIALRETTGTPTLSDKQITQTLDRYTRERESHTPEWPWFVDGQGNAAPPFVAHFQTLFQRVQDESKMQHYGGIPLKPTEAETESILHTDQIRHWLLHFGYSSYSLSIPRILDDTRNGMAVARRLLYETQGGINGTQYFIESMTDENLSKEVNLYLADIDIELSRLLTIYEK